MASGGSSRRPTSSESRSFDFGSDELLFSYDDYTQQKDQTANAKRSDSTTKDLHENRIGRPLANVYGQQNEFPREDVLSAVEICMKKHADNLMRNLDEINGRLTQLELFCYKLERTVGEFQTDMIHGQSEADMKLKSLEKHVHEIHRSVQIIRDKQDLAEAHKELTKLHLSQNETVNSTPSHRNNEDAAAAKSAINRPQNDNSDMSNLQLTLALPNQTSPDQNPPVQDRYIQNHSSAYYAQNLPHQAPPPPFHQHQQHQWRQPMPHQQPPPPTYPPYPPYQPSIAESFQTGGMPPPPPYSAAAPQSIGYGVAGVPQVVRSSRIGADPYPPQPNMRQAYNSAFAIDGTRAARQAYNSAFAIDGTRAAHPQSYLPSSPVMRNHPYGEVIEKAVSMGYSRDHVVNVVKMMGETGQPLDFNSVLDELNVHANGGAPRAWSR